MLLTVRFLPLTSLFGVFLLVFCALLAMLWGGDAKAAKKVDLYFTSQLVLDESETIRQQAAITGLSTVMIRVAGNKQILNNPQIKQALAQSSSYITQYSYESTDETITLVGDTRPARRLLMQFSAAAIQNLFIAAQIAIWPDIRPEVLLWVAADTQGRTLLGDQTEEVQLFKSAAVERGLPLSMPLLDLSDRQALSGRRLWALDESVIREASDRYASDAVLAGRLTQNASNSWRGSFILLHKGQRLYFNASGSNQQQVSRKIINQASDYLANIDALIVSEEGTAPLMTVMVNNITTFESYTGLLNYLKALPVVADIAVRRVEGETIVLDLGYNGTQEKLLSTLNTSELLESVVTQASAVEAFVTYRWR